MADSAEIAAPALKSPRPHRRKVEFGCLAAGDIFPEAELAYSESVCDIMRSKNENDRFTLLQRYFAGAEGEAAESNFDATRLLATSDRSRGGDNG